ncbi:MAG: ABC-2 transporter permease [Clostridiales bacterium]|nr:ABC-2 transporter permease [Clostridiales bacterium]
MLGLLRKDFSLLKAQLRFYLIALLMIILFLCVSDVGTVIAGIPAFFALMLSINCFAYDEQCHFDKLAATLPVSRRGMVCARYLYGGIVTLAASLLALGAEAGARLMRRLPVNLPDLLLQAAAGIGVSLLIIAILYPAVYKFGVQKSRIIVVIVILVPALAFPLLLEWMKLDSLTLPPAPVGTPLLVALVMAALAASLLCSFHVVQHKEY